MLRILLIIIFLYLAYQCVLKPILRILLQYVLKRAIDQQLGKNNQDRSYQDKRSKPEGSINIDYIPKNGKKSNTKDNSDEGEYIEYEEVK